MQVDSQVGFSGSSSSDPVVAGPPPFSRLDDYHYRLRIVVIPRPSVGSGASAARVDLNVKTVFQNSIKLEACVLNQVPLASFQFHPLTKPSSVVTVKFLVIVPFSCGPIGVVSFSSKFISDRHIPVCCGYEQGNLLASLKLR